MEGEEADVGSGTGFVVTNGVVSFGVVFDVVSGDVVSVDVISGIGSEVTMCFSDVTSFNIFVVITCDFDVTGEGFEVI